jgi:hypothetical protein
MAGWARGMRSEALAVFPGAAKRGEPAANGIRPPRCFGDFAIDVLFVPVASRRPDVSPLFLSPGPDTAKPNGAQVVVYDARLSTEYGLDPCTLSRSPTQG